MYYPKSQIKTNLYSNPGEFVNATTFEPYSGYYFTISTGKFFTGKTPQDVPNTEIIRSSNLSETLTTPKTDVFIESPTDTSTLPSQLFTSEYNSITGTPDVVFSNIPPYFATLPTEQDYQNGEFRRYFCKKTNEILYIEISKTTFDLLINKSPDILWPLYSPFNLAWQITGIKEQVARTNKNIVDLTSVRLQLPKLGEYLNNNYLKYYR
jgi:hypothetical protein